MKLLRETSDCVHTSLQKKASVNAAAKEYFFPSCLISDNEKTRPHSERNPRDGNEIFGEFGEFAQCKNWMDFISLIKLFQIFREFGWSYTMFHTQVFYVPLRDQADGPAPILNKRDVADIFMNLEDIMAFSSEMQKKLKKRIDDESSLKVGDIFLNLVCNFLNQIFSKKYWRTSHSYLVKAFLAEDQFFDKFSKQEQNIFPLKNLCERRFFVQLRVAIRVFLFKFLLKN